MDLWPQTPTGTLVDILTGTVHSRPSLHLHADQCTIGMSTCFFMTSRLRATSNYDPFHRLWNDCQEGFKLGSQWGLSVDVKISKRGWVDGTHDGTGPGCVFDDQNNAVNGGAGCRLADFLLCPR